MMTAVFGFFAGLPAWFWLLALLVGVGVIGFRRRQWFNHRWLSHQIARRRQRAIDHRIAQKAHEVLTTFGTTRQRDIDFVYRYTTDKEQATLGAQARQDPKIFDYQGSFPVLNHTETSPQHAQPLFTLRYKGGLAYEHYQSSSLEPQASENPYASVIPRETIGSQQPEPQDALTLLIIAADYKAPHYQGDCIAIYRPRDENAYASNEGLELVFICIWKAFHRERYQRAISENTNAYAWRGDVLLYFPGKWERLLTGLDNAARQHYAQEAEQKSQINQESLKRRFLTARERERLAGAAPELARKEDVPLIKQSQDSASRQTLTRPSTVVNDTAKR